MAMERVDGLGINPGDAATGAPGKAPAKTGSAQQGAPSFGDLLLESIHEANRLQHSADAAIQGLATGKVENVAEVMTAVEKADMAFRTLMQVRNKLVDAYEELMRLRV